MAVWAESCLSSGCSAKHKYNTGNLEHSVFVFLLFKYYLLEALLLS